jgi:hypothetical protein
MAASNLSNLSLDVLTHLVSFLPSSDLVRIARVSKAIYRAARSNIAWQPRKELLLDELPGLRSIFHEYEEATDEETALRRKRRRVSNGPRRTWYVYAHVLLKDPFLSKIGKFGHIPHRVASKITAEVFVYAFKGKLISKKYSNITVASDQIYADLVFYTGLYLRFRANQRDGDNMFHRGGGANDRRPVRYEAVLAPFQQLVECGKVRSEKAGADFYYYIKHESSISQGFFSFA